MKSKLITAALVAIVGFAVADLIRAALYPNAAKLAVETERPEVATAAPAETSAPRVGLPLASTEPDAGDTNEPTADLVSIPAAAGAGAQERHIVIQPGSDLVVIETDTAPAGAEARTAIIPASIGEAAASDANVLKASAGLGDMAAPRVSNAAPAAPDLVIEPAVVQTETRN